MLQFGHVIRRILISSYGTSQIAVYDDADNVSALASSGSSAMTLSIMTVIGQRIDANDNVQSDYYMKKMLKIAVIIGTANCLLILQRIPTALKLDTSSL